VISLTALGAAAFAGVGVGALAPDLTDEFGFSRTEIGIVSALVMLGASTASRPMGKLTDRLGPYKVLIGSLVAMAVAAAISATAVNGWVLMAGVLLLGLAYGAVGPPTNVAIAGRMQGGIGFFMSLKQAGMPAGSFLAGLILPSVAEWLSWRWAIALTGVVALAVAAFSGPLRRTGSIDRGSGRSAIGRDEAPPQRTWWALGAFGFLMAGGQWCFLGYLVLYLHDERGFSHPAAGAALAVGTACSVGGRLVWGWVSDRPGWRARSLMMASVLGTIGCSLLAADLPRPLIWPVVALTGAALIGWNGAFLGVVADRAKRGTVGHASGTVMTIVFAGAVAVPPLFGWLSEVADAWTLIWGLAAGFAACAGIALKVFLPPEPPAAAPAAPAPAAP
jgi:MFS family permease